MTLSSPDRRPSAAAFLGMGLSAAGVLAVGVWLGVLADQKWHTSPWFLLLGIVLGSGAAVSTVVVQVKRFL